MTKKRGKFMKKGLSLLLVVIMMLTAVPLAGITANSAMVSAEEAVGAKDPTVYSQFGHYEHYWGGDYHGWGCGVFSTINAVKYLTGNKIPYKDLGNYAMKHGYQGTFNVPIKSAKEDEFGVKYGYKLSEYITFGSSSRWMRCWIGNKKYSENYPSSKEFETIYAKLVSHLSNGDVAVVLVLGHYMAIVDYDKKTDKFLILDSAAYKAKRLTANDGKWQWVTADQLNYNKAPKHNSSYNNQKPYIQLREGIVFLSKRNSKDYTLTTDSVISTTNETAMIKSTISPKATVENWGFYLSTDEDAIKNVDGTKTPHEDKGKLDWSSVLPEDQRNKSYSEKTFTVHKYLGNNLIPGKPYYYKFCIKINGKWYDTTKNKYKSFKTDAVAPSAPTINMDSKYAHIGTNGLNSGGEPITVTWKAVNGAKTYCLNMLCSDKSTLAHWHDGLTSLSLACDPSWFKDPGTYYLQLIAKNSVGDTVSTNTVEVIVHPDVTVTFYDTVSKMNISEPQTIPYGTAADEPPLPSQTGYSFDGWDKSFNNVKEDITVNTKYTPKQFTVKFVDGYNQQLIGDSQEFTYGTTISEANGNYPSAPEHKYHAFIGWSEPEYTVGAETHTITACYKWDWPTDIATDIISVDSATSDKAVTDEYGNVIKDGYNVVTQVFVPQNVTKTVKGRVVVALKTEAGRLLIETESSAFVIYPSSTEPVTKNIEVFVPYEAAGKELASAVEVYVVNNYNSAGVISNVVRDTQKIAIANADKWQYTTDASVLNRTDVELDEKENYVTYDLTTRTVKESFDESMDGYTVFRDDWIQTDSGQIEYAAYWPRLGDYYGQKTKGTQGAEFNNNTPVGYHLYNEFNHTPKSTYENNTSRVTADSIPYGAIYYHWCRDENPEGKDRNVTSQKWYADGGTAKNKYFTFHTYWVGAERDAELQAGRKYDSHLEKSFYVRNLSSTEPAEFRDKCKDSRYWTSRIPVYIQYWKEWHKKFIYEKNELTSQKVSKMSDVPTYDNPTARCEHGNRYGIALYTTEQKTVSNVTQWYAYKTSVPVSHEDKNIYDINVPVGDQFQNKDVTVYVYKDQQPSDYTTEYIGYAKTSDSLIIDGAQMREACSETTGDFTIAIAVPGQTNAVVVGKIEAPKQKYTVKYYDYDEETVVYEQTVEEGDSITAPDESLLTIPEGYRFKGWNISTIDVNRTLSKVEVNRTPSTDDVQRILKVFPQKEQITCKVTFIDWQNLKTEMKDIPYGTDIDAYLPDIPEADKTIAYWDISNCTTVKKTAEYTDETTNEVVHTEYNAHVVTSDMVITTKVDGKILAVVFLDENGDEAKRNEVEPGDPINPPSEIEEDEDIIFEGWKNEETGEYLDCTNVKTAGTYYPVYEFANTVEIPTASVTTGEYTSNQTVTLSCETENAVIYYSIDKTDPSTAEVNEDDNDPKGVHEYKGPITLTKPTTLYFCAMAMGMNNSGTVAELYAINTATSGVKYHLVTVYSNLPQNEGAYYQELIKASTKMNASAFRAVEGYTYEGLFFDVEGEDEFDPNSDLITEETTLYAIYTPKKYTATFKDYDGTQLSTSTVDYGTSAEAPTPSRDGYVFIGWDSDDFEYMTSSKTFTAQYCLESEYARVSLNKTTLTKQEGDGAKLKAIVTPAELSDTELIWETNNAEVATVDQNGVVECLFEGSATITVTVVATGECSECFVTVSPNADKTLYLADGSPLDIDAQRYLRRIPVNANTVSEIRENFANDELKLSFFGINNAALTDTDLVGTGSVVKLMDGETVLDQITAIMTGDFDGNGKVQTIDLAMIAQCAINTRTASEIQAIAVDVNGDGVVNVKDCAMVSRSLAGKEELE